MLEKLEAYYKNLALTHEKQDRNLEALTCYIYLAIIKECKGKFKRGKHEEFIRKSYDDAHNRIQQLGGEFTEDAFLAAMRKNCFMIVWQMLGFERNHLHVFAYRHRVNLPDLTGVNNCVKITTA